MTTRRPGDAAVGDAGPSGGACTSATLHRCGVWDERLQPGLLVARWRSRSCHAISTRICAPVGQLRYTPIFALQ